jgi:hypothetical protein
MFLLLHVSTTFCSHHQGAFITQTWAACLRLRMVIYILASNTTVMHFILICRCTTRCSCLYNTRSWWRFRTVAENFFCIPSLFYLPVHSRCRGFLFSLDHTQTYTAVGRTPLDEGSARRRDFYLTPQTLYKRQKSMPPVGFEPTIPASARPQTDALGGAAIVIGNVAENVGTKNTLCSCW